MCSKFEAGNISGVILCNGDIKNETSIANIKIHAHEINQFAHFAMKYQDVKKFMCQVNIYASFINCGNTR
ncbi:hypothetical protein CYR55_15980 [Chimaeribacter californicus]|uniref:Uncharacterized protein n=1 Tax=Chimaeribacter californicus TaxID=2060067 RepID=A0A2N5E0X2_9GAMM|nr:hypothetical protein CYR55_15980 [Chimaeribacter californicus]